jgi:hypothetical protein
MRALCQIPEGKEGREGGGGRRRDRKKGREGKERRGGGRRSAVIWEVGNGFSYLEQSKENP